MHYVISDIHGQHEAFLKMLRKIKFSKEDELYILGDVIDRGPDGIKTLQYIMKHDNIHFCLGNHEYMMFQYLQALDNGWDLDAKQKGRLWMERNRGKVTYDSFKLLSEEKQKEMYEFLWSTPLFYPNVKVGDKTFYLVHGNPFYTQYEEPVSMVDIGNSENEVFPVVWEDYGATVDGKTVIHGHTINFRGRISFKEGTIDVDCGAAGEYCLGCLRLEDYKEYYVPLKDFAYVARYHNRSHKDAKC